MSRSFNGSSSSLTLASALVTGNPFTLSAWVKTVAETANMCAVSVGLDGTTQYGYIGIRGDEGTDPVVGQGRDGGATVQAKGSTTDTGSWINLCGTFDSGTIRIYKAGVFVAEATGAYTPNALDRFSIGSLFRDSEGSWFNGLIADVGVWDVILSDPNIALIGGGRFADGVDAGNQVLYQALQTAVNQSGYVGPSLTDNNTSHSADHPTLSTGDTPGGPVGDAQGGVQGSLFNSLGIST